MLDRNNPYSAIPQLEKMVKAVSKETDSLKDKTYKIDQEISNQNMYRVDVVSSNGNLLKGGLINTMLIARVSSWDIDITKDIDANNFIWTRNTGNKEEDTVWNNKHITGMKYVEIGLEDVGRQATFTCKVTIKEVVAETQIVIATSVIEESIQDNVENLQDDMSLTSKDVANLNEGVLQLGHKTEAINESITKVENDITNNQTNISDVRELFVGLASTVDSIDKNKASLEDLTKIQTLFNSVFDITPDGLKIKGVDTYGQESTISTLISFDKWSFKEQGQTVAYISNKALNIENAIIRNQLTVGKHDITTDGDSFEVVYIEGE